LNGTKVNIKEAKDRTCVQDNYGGGGGGGGDGGNVSLRKLLDNRK
jgi:hypothetical protein